MYYNSTLSVVAHIGGDSLPKSRMRTHTTGRKVVLHLQLPTHNERTFQVDIADVGNYQSSIGVLAIYDGVFQNEGGKLVV